MCLYSRQYNTLLLVGVFAVLACPMLPNLQHFTSSTFITISQGKLVMFYVYFALNPFTLILLPGTGLGPWLVLLNSLAAESWPHLCVGELPARVLPVNSVRLLLIHPDVNMSRPQASRTQRWSGSSIPFQEKSEPLWRKKKKNLFFLSLQTHLRENTEKRRKRANIQQKFFFSRPSWRKK